MSADDGVYILHDSKNGTWRVAHVQAIDNLDWYVQKLEEALEKNGDKMPFTEWVGGPTHPSAKAALEAYLLNTWGNAKVHKGELLALHEAAAMLKNFSSICEYGIQFIEMPDTWVVWPQPKKENAPNMSPPDEGTTSED